MEAVTLKFASVVLFLSMIALFFVASADSSYDNPQVDGRLPSKSVIPNGKSNPKLPTKPVIPKETPKLPTKPMIPKEEHGAYGKSNPKLSTKHVIPKENPKLPTKPVIPKEEHGPYGKIDPKLPAKPMIPRENSKLPTKPVTPKEEHGAYGKIDPKLPAKPMIPKENPKLPTKPVIPKEQHGAYGKIDPKPAAKPVIPKENTKLPTKPTIPKEEHGANGNKDPKLPTKPLPKEEHGAYGKNSPKIPTPENPMLPKVPEHPHNIAVQGLVYCKYGSKLIPLKGATVRVSCLAVNKNGYKKPAPFAFSSCPADVKGYFLAKISSTDLPLLKEDDTWEVRDCKSFLENSPWSGCKVPEDTNGGITGAPLTFSRLLNGYSLSSVGPFIYNPGPQPSLPKEGY